MIHFLYQCASAALSSLLWQWCLLLLQVSHVCGVSKVCVHVFSMHNSLTAAGKILSCDPLMNIGTINITTGACVLITALCCSFYLCCTRADDPAISRGIHVICCLSTCLILLIFLGMAIAGSVLVANNYDTIKNGSYVDNGERASCKNSEIPFVLTILSWVIWLLVCCCGMLSWSKCVTATK